MANTEVSRLQGVAASMRRVRVFGIGFAVIQFTLYSAPQGVEMPFARWPVLGAVIAWLVATNLATLVVGRVADVPRLRLLAHLEIAADALVILALVVSFNFDPTTRLWPLLSLPILQAAMRSRMRPTMITWAAVGSLYAIDQIRLLPARDSPESWIGHIPFALGVLLIIGLISGLLSSRVESARGAAERTAGTLRRLSAFSRDLSAIRHTDEVVNELLRAGAALTGFTNAEFHTTGSDGWVCARRLDVRRATAPIVPIPEYELDALARAPREVHSFTPDAPPFTHVTLLGIPRREGTFAALALATEGEADLTTDETEVLLLLAAQAAVALDNAALIEREGDTIEDLRALHGLKDDFVSILTHELKSPLTSVAGYADLLRRNWERIEPDDRERYLEAIERNGNHLARLIDDVLDATNAERQVLAAVPQVLDLAPLVAAMAEEEVGSSPLHRLEAAIEPDVPPVRVDPDRARQVLRNLINNAVKYSPDGGRVGVELTSEGDEVVFRVIDDGVGIPEHLRDQLFKKFSRLPSRAQVKGTGLGLFLCRELVHQMGGTIGVTSEPDRGSTFWIRLPAASPAEQRTARDAADSPLEA